MDGEELCRLSCCRSEAVHQDEQDCVLQVVHFCGVPGRCWTCMQFGVPCATYKPSPSQGRVRWREVQAAGAVAVFRLFGDSGRAAFCSFCSFCTTIALVVPNTGWQALPCRHEPVP